MRKKLVTLVLLTIAMVSFTSLLFWLPALSSRMRNEQLKRAVERGEALRVSQLLDQGGNPNLNLCAEWGPPSWLMWAKDYLPESVSPKTCYVTKPLLVSATEARSTDITIALIQHKAELDVCSSYDQKSPLHIAVENKDIKTVQILLDAGANPNYTSGFLQEAPLFYAADKNPAILKLLIQHGANCRLSTNGYTTLQKAAECGNIAALDILLKHGVSIDVRGQLGETALMAAALDHQLDTVRFLLSRGANPKLRTDRGESALDYAQYANSYGWNKEVVRFLRQQRKRK